MPLKLYNTLTNKEEEFSPLCPPKVSMYTCGPTVYGRPHIGNYSSFLMADLLRRWLEVSGYDVTHVKNITDVGHMVADQDEGEDKIEKQAREEKGEKAKKADITKDDVMEIVEKYTQQYLEDEKSLNMLDPWKRPRATAFIVQMKEMISDLLREKKAYVIRDDGIYFDVSKANGYGKLSGNTLDKLEAGSRIAINEQKKHPADFALWKFCVGPNAHHVLRWSSPGEDNPEGFPGWHIECSAMSRALLGDQIDIHTGGEDNIFPHHECEIAQSESVTGKKPFVGLWLHRRRIDMGSEKMSKSLGNVLSLDDIRDMGYSPLDLRYYLLSVHYRTNLKFTKKGLDDAHKARRKIMEWMDKVEADSPNFTAKGIPHGVDLSIQSFSKVMDSDLNTSEALSEIFSAMNFYYAHELPSKSDGELYIKFINLIRETFGCFEPEEQEKYPRHVEELHKKYEQARAEKKFDVSDRLREEIRKQGYEVRDGDEGSTIHRL